MKGTWFAAACAGLLALLAGGTSGGPTAKDVEDLARRLSRVESQAAALERSVSALESPSAKDSRDASSSCRNIARQVADLQKAVADLKNPSPAAKDTPATRAEVKVLSDRLNSRTSQLAEWLDQYHRRSETPWYHRNEIARK
jgi:hypothetical protein